MEILGLLDTLESIVLDGSKIPFSKKVMVNEDELLKVIDKIRLVVQGGSDYARKAIGSKGGEVTEKVEVSELQPKPTGENKAAEVIEQAYQMAKEIRDGADKYADEVLANIEATSTRILRTVKAGRDRLKGNNEAS
ncbi:MAG: hypothetical protein ABIH50_04605 [bacterium]